MGKRSRHIFVAYSREDTPFVNKFAADLRTSGLDAWIDRFDLTPGTPDWETALRNAIRGSKGVILIATPASRQSPFVKDEIRIAKIYQRPIYPLWAGGEEWMECIPMGMGGVQYLDARGGSYDTALRELSAILEAEIPSPLGVDPGAVEAVKVEVEPNFKPRNPYKGLRPFMPADTGDYFGREACLEHLVGRVESALQKPPHLLAIVGASGSGKSSLVMAGLLPRVNRLENPPLILPRVLPGEHPLESLAISLSQALGRSSVDILFSLRRVVEETRVLHVLIQELGRPTILFIDQFEELFTLTKSEEDRKQFLSLITASINEPRAQLLVIITLRADFYDRPLSHPELGGLMDRCTEVVLPMTMDEMRTAIEEPANLPDVHVGFEPDLVGDLLFDVRDRPGALPLLEFALDQLFERREGQILTSHAYRAIGGVTGALAQHADEVYEELSADEQQVARQMFLRLVALGDATEDTRRRATVDELLTLHSNAGLMRRVINFFSDRRLITLDRPLGDDKNSSATVEIAHEALIQQWGLLNDWLTNSREDLLIQRRLSEAAREWKAKNREKSFLARGGRLEQLETWASATDLALTDEEELYLRESILERSREEEVEVERKTREATIARRASNFGRVAILLALVSLVALVILGFTATSLGDIQIQATQVAGFVAQESARAESLRLSSIANGILQDEGDAQLAGLFSVRALRDFDTPQSDDTLVRSLLMMNRGVVIGGDISGVWTLALSPDRSLVALAGRDGVTRIRDVASWTEAHVLERHEDVVCAVAFSHDGQRILTGSFDRTARLWDAQTGELLRVLEGSASDVCTVVFSNDDRRALTAGGEAQARLWDLETGEVLQIFSGHSDDVYDAAFSPDGRYLVTGSADHTARLYDLATGDFLRSFTGHNATVFAVAFSPDSSELLTGSSDYSVKLWDVATGDVIRSLYGHDGIVSSVNFSPDGRRLITGSVDRTVRIWNTATGETLTVLRGHRDNVFLVAFEDEHTVVSGSIDGTLREWNLVGGVTPRLIQAHTDQVYTLEVSRDGKTLVSGGNDHVVNVIDLATGQVLRAFGGHEDSITTVTFSPDGQRIVSTSDDGTVRVWDVANGTAVAMVSHGDGSVLSAAYTPDGSRFFTGGADPAIKIWDAASLAQVGSLEGHTGTVNSIVFNHDGTRMLSASDDQSVRLWNVETGATIATFEFGVPAYVAKFLPNDENKVIIATGDFVVHLYNLESHEVEGTFSGHTNSVLSLDISPDGRLLVTGSKDNTVRIWDIASQRLLRALHGHLESVEVVTFTRDGKQIISGSKDFTIQIHDVDVADFIAYACTMIQRDFTTLERDRYELNDTQSTCPQLSADTIALLPTTTPLADVALPVWTQIPLPTPYAGPALLESDILRIPIGANIVVDGDLSDWSDESFVTVETGIDLSSDPEENGSFRFALAADNDFLYVAATTPDKTIVTGEHGRDYWNEDSFEFYVNTTGNFIIDTYIDGIYQININALYLDDPVAVPETVNGVPLALVPVEAFTFHTDDGWGFEARYPFGDYEPAPGSEIGFQAHYNGSAGGDRNVKLIWSSLDTTDNSWQDPTLFGRIIFVDPDES
ncbi:MAG: TIR domain-containing protein [Anaerolineae bacterium]|nr:TIR domain-containing protein [Anaerolineae bacterium]